MLILGPTSITIVFEIDVFTHEESMNALVASNKSLCCTSVIFLVGNE
jgi:hypothetical protein